MEEDLESFVDQLVESTFNELKNYQLSFSPDVIQRFRSTLIDSNMSKAEIEDYVSKIREAWINRQKTNAAIKSGKSSGNFETILNAIETIFSDEVLSSSMTIFGGTIPYLVTRKQPRRIIGDVDTLVSIDDMPKVRQVIASNPSKFQIVRDTLEATGHEYGFDMLIDGAMVSVFPTVADERGMIIKNFHHDFLKNMITLASTLFPGIHMSEEIQFINVDGRPVRIMSPEFTYLTKSIGKRNNDREDLPVLEQVINHEKVIRMRNALRIGKSGNANRSKSDSLSKEIDR